MAIGLEVYGPHGEMILPLTGKWARFFGYRDINKFSTTGSFSYEISSGDRRFVIVHPLENDVVKFGPTVEVTSTGFRWEYFWSSDRINVRVYYGVY